MYIYIFYIYIYIIYIHIIFYIYKKRKGQDKKVSSCFNYCIVTKVLSVLVLFSFNVSVILTFSFQWSFNVFFL